MTAFSEIQKIRYEGPQSKNALAFRHYNESEVVAGKTMKDHLRFSVAYWHTMRGSGSDPFGPATMLRPWESGCDNVDNAQKRVRVAFEFIEKLTAPFFCFHDRDIAPRAVRWPRPTRIWTRWSRWSRRKCSGRASSCCGARPISSATPVSCMGPPPAPMPMPSPTPRRKSKKALEVTKELGGEGYVFWGGREGYQTLWNTDMKREFEHLARFMHMAVDYARQIGFQGQFYFEPKPKEPTKHQYDFDCAACINFLRAYGLADHVKMNIETNHATLAGHTVEHELDYAGAQGFLGSVDANTGDLLLGWDTDQFPTNVYLTTKMMLIILKYGGFSTGGLNFDAKVRRKSFEPVDLFHAHVGGMDAFAKGLKIAAAIRAEGLIDALLKQRYSSWDGGIGGEIEAGKHDFASLEKYILAKGDAAPNISGRQELLENLFNRYVF